MAKVSVIIPVYKAANCLRRCVDSILNQTFTDFELILVDDGSPDQSGRICDEYAIRDTRVKTVHKENGGVSTARNAGLDIAIGKWIVFVDSDDWCESNYLSDFFCTSEILADNDVVIQGRRNETSAGVVSSNLVLHDDVYSNIVSGMLQANLLTFGAPYCKLYPSRLIEENNIRFPVDYSYGEDTVFFFRVLLLADRVITISKCNYHYVDYDEGSLSKKDHDFNPLATFLKESMSLVTEIDKKFNSNGALINAYMQNYTRLLLRSIVNIYRLGYSKQEKKDCFRIAKSNLTYLHIVADNFVLSFIRIIPICLLIPLFGIAVKLCR